jgi:dihydropteroate synthase
LDGASPDERDFASVAVTTMLAREGVWGVRTHSVKPHKDAIKVVERWTR